MPGIDKRWDRGLSSSQFGLGEQASIRSGIIKAVGIGLREVRGKRPGQELELKRD